MVEATSKACNYLTELTNGTVSVIADVSVQKGGAGNNFRPHELLCAALASCMNITTRNILDRLHLNYENVRTTIELEITQEQTCFCYHIEIDGALSEQMKEKVISLAENCPVRKTLSNEIQFKNV